LFPGLPLSQSFSGSTTGSSSRPLSVWAVEPKL
jgi:hypothetical protein